MNCLQKYHSLAWLLHSRQDVHGLKSYEVSQSMLVLAFTVCHNQVVFLVMLWWYGMCPTVVICLLLFFRGLHLRGLLLALHNGCSLLKQRLCTQTHNTSVPQLDKTQLSMLLIGPCTQQLRALSTGGLCTGTYERSAPTTQPADTDKHTLLSGWCALWPLTPQTEALHPNA